MHTAAGVVLFRARDAVRRRRRRRRRPPEQPPFVACPPGREPVDRWRRVNRQIRYPVRRRSAIAFRAAAAAKVVVVTVIVAAAVASTTAAAAATAGTSRVSLAQLSLQSPSLPRVPSDRPLNMGDVAEKQIKDTAANIVLTPYSGIGKQDMMSSVIDVPATVST